MIQALRKVIKRMHYALEEMLTCVRWNAACPLSLRHIEEMMAERGVCVDHATVHRWAIKRLGSTNRGRSLQPWPSPHNARRSSFRQALPSFAADPDGASVGLRRCIDSAGQARALRVHLCALRGSFRGAVGRGVRRP
jgi:hypothetical protein